MYVTKTMLTGERVLVNHASIIAIQEYARFHNLRFVETDEQLGEALPSFIAVRNDAEPLTEAELTALRECAWLPSADAPYEYYGCGAVNTAIAHGLRRPRSR